jgi:hypothetical protein
MIVKNLLVSFSGGETSAFMAHYLNNHYEDFGYENIVFVFANTGLENEETLEFIENCDKHFKLGVQWIEAHVINKPNVGTHYNHTDFDYAKRSGEPFEAVIAKYGIPNMTAPHCSRELKSVPIRKFGKDWFNGEKYHTAIGIRKDEWDRMNDKAAELGIIYPLIYRGMLPTNKAMVNLFWKSMPFRLELKGYQGNCVTCWKKSDNKLYQIAKETPREFDFMDKMETEYGNFIPEERLNKLKQEGKEVPTNITFFRGNRSAKDILEQSKTWNGIIKNDAENYDYQLDLFENESCEIFTECGTNEDI